MENKEIVDLLNTMLEELGEFDAEDYDSLERDVERATKVLMAS